MFNRTSKYCGLHHIFCPNLFGADLFSPIVYRLFVLRPITVSIAKEIFSAFLCFLSVLTFHLCAISIVIALVCMLLQSTTFYIKT